MRFALLGSHPDGLEMASALVEVGGHELIAYTGLKGHEDYLRRWGASARPVGDLEEVLANPAIEMVIVAGNPSNRPTQLRRALQSERHVLCVHPADQNADIGHEAAMIQQDTKCLLMPLLYEALHPAFTRLAQMLDDPDGPVGALQLMDRERRFTGGALLDAEIPGHRPSVPGWDVLRRLGGEIIELSAFTSGEELDVQKPTLLFGAFKNSELFQASLLPNQERAMDRMTLSGTRGKVQLLFPIGWPGPAFLSWRDANGRSQEEAFEVWDPWPTMVKVFEQNLGREKKTSLSRPTWQDAVHGLELDEAARRSVERRRTSTLEYQEASEEVGFKSTMTLVGCGLLWAILLLLILSYWAPVVGWIIIPVLVLFLGMQLLRWVIPREQSTDASAKRR